LQLGVDIFDMRADGVSAQRELAGNHFLALAGDEQVENVFFPFGQLIIRLRFDEALEGVG
jgi:hypothetical protein